MRFEVRPIGPLGAGSGSSSLYGDWLGGTLGALGGPPPALEATAALADALQGPGWPQEGTTRVAPLFAGEWTQAHLTQVGADLPGPVQRERLAATLQALRRGEAGTVVTGQQPGFLGGPLYTLYKVATAIALAAKRTAGGRPTVPVFWLGDDDTDLREGLAPVGWDFARGEFLRSEGLALLRTFAYRGRTVGSLEMRIFGAAAASWLAEVGATEPGGSCAADLSRLHERALTQDWSLGRLTRAAIARAFAGSGLVVVSGDDPGLHAAAAPFSRILCRETRILADLARERGRSLEQGGWHAQIQERSLRRPWFRAADRRRLPAGDHPEDLAAADLRPGVMVRSLLQDWLLEPVAVVVGPGEFAYLRQLDPLYRHLGLPRSPLVPRLGGWVLPRGLSPAKVTEPRRVMAESHLPDGRWADALADDLAAGTAAALSRALQERLGVPADRAAGLAAGRSRRWRRGLVAMLKAEAAGRDASPRADLPPWVLPAGVRQERALAWVAALGAWSDPLLAAVQEAAQRHLEEGMAGRWQEFMIEVDDPAARHAEAPGRKDGDA